MWWESLLNFFEIYPQPILALTRPLSDDEATVLELLNLIPAKVLLWVFWTGLGCWSILLFLTVLATLKGTCLICDRCCCCCARRRTRRSPNTDSHAYTTPHYTELGTHLTPLVRDTTSGALPPSPASPMLEGPRPRRTPSRH